MSQTSLDVAATRDMFVHVAHGMEASLEYLTDLDRAIGDGDHGLGMQHGFEGVRKDLAVKAHDSVGKVLHGVGTSLLMSIGGASGAIFGTLFRAGSAKLQEEGSFTSAGLARFLADGLQAVQARGGAKPGDKTMIDALEPASRRAAELVAAPLPEALTEAAEAARQGLERTKGMLASTGKAKTLGERSLGHPDPGAASMYLILKLMAEFASKAPAGSEGA